MRTRRDAVAAVSCSLLLLFLVASTQGTPPTASSEREAVLHRAQRNNNAWRRLVETRHAYEQERLRRLQVLLARGHASWLETARQAAAVEALGEYLQAAAAYGKWLDDLCVQTSRDNEGSASCDAPTRSRHDTTDVDAAQIKQTVQPDRLRVARAEMKLAEAEYAVLFEPQDDHQPATPSADQPTHRQPHFSLPTLACFLHTQLAQANLRQVELESRAVAGVKIAEILARRAQLHLDAIAKLHQQNHATSHELEEARTAAHDAQQRLSEEREIARQRKRMWNSRQYQQAAFDNEPPEEGPAALSKFTAADPQPVALSHFIALRRAQFQAEAQRRESETEAQLLRELRRRLEATGLQHDAARRERQKTSLDLQLALARVNSRQSNMQPWKPKHSS